MTTKIFTTKKNNVCFGTFDTNAFSYIFSIGLMCFKFDVCLLFQSDFKCISFDFILLMCSMSIYFFQYILFIPFLPPSIRPKRVLLFIQASSYVHTIFLLLMLLLFVTVCCYYTMNIKNRFSYHQLFFVVNISNI